MYIPQNKAQQDMARDLCNRGIEFPSFGGPLVFIFGTALVAGILTGFWFLGKFLWNHFGFGDDCTIWDIVIIFPIRMTMVLLAAMFVCALIRSRVRETKK